MKLMYGILALCVWWYSSVNSLGVEEDWITQRQDHFNNDNPELWNQRFQFNFDFYKNGGPIFLLVVGPYPISKNLLKYGDMADYAQKFNAMCIQLEHRYYGASFPVANMSNENMVHLNSVQALADLSVFIQYINGVYGFSKRTKWVAFGSFYGGTLAAWLRKKHPNLIHMAVVTNPLVAKLDYHEFYDEVELQIAAYNPKCVTQIKKAFEEFYEIIDNGNQGLKLTDKFMLCEYNLNTNDSRFDIQDLSFLLESLSNNFAMCGHYDQAKISLIRNLYDIMLNESIPKALDRLATASIMAMNYNNLKCQYSNYTRHVIKPYSNITFEKIHTNDQVIGKRQWKYQLCREFGLFTTSNQTSHVFSDEFDYSYFLRMCQDIFGLRLPDDVLPLLRLDINTLYDELNIQLDRTIYVHSSTDPWHLLRFNETRTKNTAAVYMKGISHCVNVDHTMPSIYLPEVKEARNSVRAYLRKWLAED